MKFTHQPIEDRKSPITTSKTSSLCAILSMLFIPLAVPCKIASGSRRVCFTHAPDKRPMFMLGANIYASVVICLIPFKRGGGDDGDKMNVGRFGSAIFNSGTRRQINPTLISQ